MYNVCAVIVHINTSITNEIELSDCRSTKRKRKRTKLINVGLEIIALSIFNIIIFFLFRSVIFFYFTFSYRVLSSQRNIAAGDSNWASSFSYYSTLYNNTRFL